MIRPAIPEDASRIAEILVFSKRTNYRSIFHNDAYSFGKLQVLPLALELQRDTALLSEYWVYDDEFVKGLVRISGEEIVQCYVDVFFVGQGIGGALLDFACEQRGAWFLWVLEKNPGAQRFYRRHGFAFTGERRPEPETPEFLLKMQWKK